VGKGLNRGIANGAKLRKKFQYLTYFRRFILYFKITNIYLNEFEISIFVFQKKFSLYFKDLACHSRGQSVP